MSLRLIDGFIVERRRFKRGFGLVRELVFSGYSSELFCCILIAHYILSLVNRLIIMGGLMQKLVFKSGGEKLKVLDVKSFFDFKVNDIKGHPFDF
jgi:hypothetical protein